jgi:hypothetical protein
MAPTATANDEAQPKQQDAPLFDEFGRCIPGVLQAPAHRLSRRYFRIDQPEIDYPAIHARIVKHLGAAAAPSPAEFEARAERILVHLRRDPRLAGILEGVRVPFLLPHADYPDYGLAVEETYLAAVAAAYQEKLPAYRFVNHCKGGLTGKLGVANGSRHERLLERMRVAPVVGYYFPCLTEYSVPAAVEQVALLPARFLLAGGFDTCAAFVGSPDLLLRRDGYPPVLWLSGSLEAGDRAGYHFEAYGYNLTFNRRVHLGNAAESWASGLVVLEEGAVPG